MKFMEKKIKCPYCKSENIEHTVLGYGERVVTGTFAAVLGLGASVVGGMFNHAVGHNAGHKTIEGVMDNTSSEYRCNKCGKTFHASKK